MIKKLLKPLSNAFDKKIRNIIYEEAPLKNAYLKSIPQVVLHKLEFHISDTCNLNCAGCNHFSPLAKENTVNYEVVKKDLTRVSELFGDRIGTLSILGGEPLLNKDINDYIILCRNLFPHVFIRIVTNGLLIPKMDENFWKLCKDNRITIAVTKYPVKVDYDLIEKIIIDHGIKIEKMNFAEKDMIIFPIDEDGRQDVNMNYYQRCTSNDCSFLKNGKIYPCAYAPNICFFNEHFHKNIPLKESDGIDIYKADSAEEILEFLSRPIQFCRFCVRHDNRHIKWKVSEKNIMEWHE